MEKTREKAGRDAERTRDCDDLLARSDPREHGLPSSRPRDIGKHAATDRTAAHTPSVPHDCGKYTHSSCLPNSLWHTASSASMTSGTRWGSQRCPMCMSLCSSSSRVPGSTSYPATSITRRAVIPSSAELDDMFAFHFSRYGVDCPAPRRLAGTLGTAC